MKTAMSVKITTRLAAAALMASAGSAAIARANTPEVEPNDNKATATVVPAMSAGDSFSGTKDGNADYFLVNVAGESTPGIYRYNLTLSAAQQTNFVFHGLLVSAPASQAWEPNHVIGATQPSSDATLPNSTSPTSALGLGWYGFGSAHKFYLTQGATSAGTFGTYTMTLTQSVRITPTDLGAFQPGSIAFTTVGQGVTSDTMLRMYDGSLNPILGYANDDAKTIGGSPSNSSQSYLNRTYAPGTYYLALSAYNLANNQPLPSDDGSASDSVLDFPNVLIGRPSASTGSNAANVSFAVTDSVGTHNFAASMNQSDTSQVLWYQFTVVPAPSSAALLGLGGLAAARRRRA